jgi:hypothetical protein
MTDDDFNQALSCIPVTWRRELLFAHSWADSVKVEWDDREEPTGCIVFTKGGSEYAFLIGDDCWDVDDPRGEMIEWLLEEREAAATLVNVHDECRASAERECARLRALIRETRDFDDALETRKEMP